MPSLDTPFLSTILKESPYSLNIFDERAIVNLEKRIYMKNAQILMGGGFIKAIITLKTTTSKI